MASIETNISQNCKVEASKRGARVFRNNRGLFLTIDAIVVIERAIKSFGLKGVIDVLKSGRLRKVRAGLEAPGASDLIGWQTVTITPEMVGKNVALFVAAEVKQPGKYASAEQKNFIQNVKQAGGIAGIVHSPEEMAALVSAHKVL